MKLVKNPIFMFMLGIIVSGSAVFAVNQINASQITYTDSNNNETTVDAALNDLYDKTTGISNMTNVGMRYEYGNPTLSSSLTPPTGKNIFNGIFGTQKSVCMIMKGKIYCFANNNYSIESNRMKSIFLEENCSLNSNNYLQCKSDDFAIRYYLTGELYIYDFSTNKTCRVTTAGASTCET